MVYKQNPWHIFLEYAKSHPHIVPSNNKERSKLYQSIKAGCMCGEKHNLCGPMNISSKVKQQSIKYAMLEAKIKAYEDYVEELEHKLKSKTRVKSI